MAVTLNSLPKICHVQFSVYALTFMSTECNAFLKPETELYMLSVFAFPLSSSIVTCCHMPEAVRNAMFLHGHDD